MLKQGIKNYFKSLKYFFTPLGTMFLGMMIGFSVLLPGIANAVSSLADGIKQLAANVDLDLHTLFGYIWSSVRALDWDAPAEAIQTLLSAEWLKDHLTQALKNILGTDFETFRAQIAGLVGNFTETLVANVILFFAFWILGFIAGFLIVKFQIRRDIAKRSLWKLILATLVNAVLTTLFIVAAAILFALWNWSAIISSVLLVLLFGIAALLEAYLVHGRGKIPLKAIVNAKNAGLYTLTNLLIFFISLLLALVGCSVNPLMGLFIGLALVEIAVIVIGLNAEAYTKSVVEQKKTNPGKK